MKKILQIVPVILLIFIFGEAGCKKDAPYMSDAIITGSDQRYCICCGGLMITFDGETRPYMGDFRRISNSSDLGITDKDIFPLYVKVDWKSDAPGYCSQIFITRFKRK